MKTILLCLILAVFTVSCSTKKENKPNLLFIMMDDLGYGHFGINNDTLKVSDFDPFYVYLVDSLEGYSLDKALEFTRRAIPTMTTLAKEGIVFTNAHASSNLCSPSRMGIATGTLQNRFGVYGNGDGQARGLTPGTHLAEKLKEQGYQTAHIGKWHIGQHDYGVVADVLNKHGIEGKPTYYGLMESHPDVFKEIEDKGYYGSVIKEHNPLNNGFDYYYGYNYWASNFYNSTYVWENFDHAGKQEGYNTDVFTDRAMMFMETQIEDDQPFYVQLHYHAVHDSLEQVAPPVYFNRFDSDSHDLNNFYAHIYGVDYNIKKIVDFLKSKEQYENTLIIFTSDNGAQAHGPYDGIKRGSPLPANAPFSGHKGNYYQGGFRVPMFVHWPDRIREPATFDHLVSTLDILPSLIDVAGGSVPQGIDGKSLMPLLENRDQESFHDHLSWAGPHSYGYGFLVKKTTKNHHTEMPFSPPAWVVRKGDYLLRFVGTMEPGIYLEYLEGREPVFELFNIKNDPAERHNLALDMPDLVQEMAEIFFGESISFQSPAVWDRAKWEELKHSRAFLDR